MLAWQFFRNLENSFKDFLDTQIVSDAVTDIEGTSIPVRVGEKADNNWTLPCVAVYVESETLPRLEIGSNIRDKRELIIIDIYATNSGERKDIANWLTGAINDGWRYYSYLPNISTPESPTKTIGGWVSVNFLTNTKVVLGQNISEFDANRHRISISVWVS